MGVPAWMRGPDAIPTSRSAAVRRGLAASARDSAARRVRVWDWAVLASQGAANMTDAHAMRVKALENMDYLINDRNRRRKRREVSFRSGIWVEADRFRLPNRDA